MNPHNALAPVGIKPQGKPWTRNSLSDPAASGEVFDTNKIKFGHFQILLILQKELEKEARRQFVSSKKFQSGLSWV